ncbi:hypothetical protein GX50_06427 [[Emmonsia] crescens]|uniref:Uncharacterized protein n=1 Tax=[Emmonsia] crescens TaxID=73230 RepID=A0A2B7ZC66_9EURO|nr:hypothetical protein GX50_06427 [Emmonsia crescens]
MSRLNHSFNHFASVIPQTAFRSLLDPEGRRAIASEPKAGHTPDWFNNLPSSAKSFMSHAHVQATAADMSVNGKGGLTSTPMRSKDWE